MEWIILKTDFLLGLLLLVAVSYAVYARRHEHLAAPWRQVARRPLAMAAAVFLLAFVSVGVLDSVHFRPTAGGEMAVNHGTEIVSALDLILSPLKQQVEKTYSAPFAVYAFAKETIELEDGSTHRDFPRLLHGGAHLTEPAGARADIFARAAYAIALASGLWVLLAACVCWRVGCGAGLAVGYLAVARKQTDFPWWAVLAALLLLMVVLGLSAALAPYYHILGTDKVGNDVLYQSLKSIRTGLLIGTLTTLVMLPFAMVLGIAAGYFRGWVDDVIQYLYTTLSSIPSVLLIAAAALMLDVYADKHAADYASLAARADLRLLALCMILGVTTWTGLCRYLRGEALKLRESDYITAARAFGVHHWVIIARHIVPNIMHIVMISVVLDFSGLVLAEAALTYINIGVDPSMESWGNMINSARLELAREPVVWWSLVAAFVFMFVLVLAANVFADAVRDAFDPRLRDAH